MTEYIFDLPPPFCHNFLIRKALRIRTIESFNCSLGGFQEHSFGTERLRQFRLESGGTVVANEGDKAVQMKMVLGVYYFNKSLIPNLFFIQLLTNYRYVFGLSVTKTSRLTDYNLNF